MELVCTYYYTLRVISTSYVILVCHIRLNIKAGQIAVIRKDGFYLPEETQA